MLDSREAGTGCGERETGIVLVLPPPAAEAAVLAALPRTSEGLPFGGAALTKALVAPRRAALDWEAAVSTLAMEEALDGLDGCITAGTAS